MAKSEWKINPQRLRHLLESKRGRLSQADLAEKLAVDKGTVSRWMRGVTAITPTHLDQLCTLLGVERDDLCNNEPIAPKAPEKPQPDKRQMNVIMDDACRNALYLVSRRYNVRMQYILAAAPLMFYILAEHSLKARRAKIEKLAEAREQWKGAIPTYFPLTVPHDEEAEGYEKESIQARDLFGNLMFGKLGYDYANIPGSTGENFDENSGNPFARFLTDQLSAVDENVREPMSWAKDDWPRYWICNEEALDLVKRDVDAANTILSGLAPLHQIHADVGITNKEQVVEWIRSRFDDMWQSMDDLVSDIGPDKPAGKKEGENDAQS